MNQSDYKVVTAPDGLWIGAVRAYRKGDLIHKDAVEANGWQDGVSGQSTNAAEQARAES